MRLIDFIKKAAVVPFEEGGRTYDGWDCWGLVVNCYRDVYGIDLPTYSGEYNSTARRDELRELISVNKIKWQPVEVPNVGDVAVLHLLGRACHTGIMVSEYEVLHTEAKTGTAVERIDRMPWTGKVEGFYRHDRRA